MAASNSLTVRTLSGVQMPRMLYGTAWKKERTTELVVQAVLAGFRGIDTAGQPKHYREDLVGAALATLSSQHGIKREALFLQTKFTSVDGQDPTNIPYDPESPIPEQVRQSFARSLANLHTEYVDSLVLHSPMRTHAKTMQVWRVFEELHEEGCAKQLGISNCYDLNQLGRLWKEAKVKPAVVQNRFYADTDYDKDIRAFCKQHGVYYQSFWTLTANPHLLKTPVVRSIAKKVNGTPEQVFFRFVMDMDIIPLTGTTNERHMRQDLAVLTWPNLSSDDLHHLKELISEE
ncbi:Aldo-keto reductase family 4 member C8 [Balamuthia mandrillaris]